eukprot:maker-scaffold17_size721972-snap-gene-6.22 protein:Tk09984 transcript:maker-scaffold17_size721972-snap-gene-6.22-mRNA-1 annotation:"sodium-dependent glucose transporter 1"
MESSSKWMVAFVIVSNLSLIFSNALLTVLGPSQPFLAKQLDIDIDTITSIWTLSSISGICGGLLSSFTFKRYITRPFWKMMVFGVGTVLTSCLIVLLPYSTTFSYLVFILILKDAVTSYWITANGGMFVYTLGAEKSRSLVMSSHFMVSLGFMLGPTLVGGYFPNTRNPGVCSTEYNDTNPLIEGLETSVNLNLIHPDVHHDQLAVEPFWILGILQLMSGSLFFLIPCLPWEMPVAEELHTEVKVVQSVRNLMQVIKDDIAILIPLVIFCFASCGSERVFQSMEFTFGLCGPLHLNPSEAVVIDKSFNGGFMVGRFFGMFVAHIVPPKLLLKSSIVMCLMLSAVISVLAAKSATVLYTCAGLYGFALSWQYASAYSWAAKFLDVVGPKSAVFSIGCYLGTMITPIMSGYLFKNVDPMAMWHLNFVLVLGQVLAVALLHRLFGEKEFGNSPEDVGPAYSRVKNKPEDDFEEALISGSGRKARKVSIYPLTTSKD